MDKAKSKKCPVGEYIEIPITFLSKRISFVDSAQGAWRSRGEPGRYEVVFKEAGPVMRIHDKCVFLTSTGGCGKEYMPVFCQAFLPLEEDGVYE